MLAMGSRPSGPDRAKLVRAATCNSQGEAVRGQLPLRHVTLALLAATTLAACGNSGGEPSRIEPVYDDATGRLQLLKYDADADGRVDTWSYMDGARVVRIELDTNKDSAVDRWEYYQPDQRIEKVGTSRGGDGAPDTWAYYSEAGTIVRLDLSTKYNGTVDRVEYYRGGALIRAEQDTTGDGRVDKWEAYEGTRLASVAFDTANTGSPDRRLVYGADGSAKLEKLSEQAKAQQ